MEVGKGRVWAVPEMFPSTLIVCPVIKEHSSPVSPRSGRSFRGPLGSCGAGGEGLAAKSGLSLGVRPQGGSPLASVSPILLVQVSCLRASCTEEITELLSRENSTLGVGNPTWLVLILISTN